METAKEWFQRCSGDPDEIKKEVKMLYEYYQSESGTSKETGFYILTNWQSCLNTKIHSKILAIPFMTDATDV